MKTNPISRIVKGALAALIACALGSQVAQAQATRTWVSGVGDDANPCSRTAPCKTFAGAISKTATNGEINVLDPGGFGQVTINKSLTIDGSGGSIAGVLASSGNGINVNGAGVVVTLRNLDINGIFNGSTGGTNGINVAQAAEVNVENCVIYEFSNVGINISPTAGASTRVRIKNTIVRNCAAGGVLAHPGTGSNKAAVSLSKCSLTSSSFGFHADDNVMAILDDCVISGNAASGVASVPTSVATQLTVNNCAINDNGTFGVASVNPVSTVFISNNTIFNNATGVGTLSSGNLNSLGNNNIRGNTTNSSINGVATPPPVVSPQ